MCSNKLIQTLKPLSIYQKVGDTNWLDSSTANRTLIRNIDRQYNSQSKSTSAGCHSQKWSTTAKYKCEDAKKKRQGNRS